MSFSAKRVFWQFAKKNPFSGDMKPSRVSVLFSKSKRPSLPFPHPWNYSEPIRILESFFCDADQEEGFAKHNRYLDIPFISPVLVTRDCEIIKSILLKTSDKEGHFDRDTLPSEGIARATGKDTLLYSNGPEWKAQKRLAAPAFGRTSLFQPEKFQEFEKTFRNTIVSRIEILEQHLTDSGQDSVEIELESEIKPVMLEMLINNFFGAQLTYDEIREVYVPALERVIQHIVRDTVMNKVGIPFLRLPALTAKAKRLKQDYAIFEKLTDLALAQRRIGTGLWSQFKSDVPDEKLRSNLRVFLAGALEATTSFASWALKHLSLNSQIQELVYQEVKDVEVYTPDNLKQSKQLNFVMEETLRLTPSLYFLPRRATADTWVSDNNGRKMLIPKGTHILLDVWHANRLDEFWGIEKTGYPASEFAPNRWEIISEQDPGGQQFMHFGFGHGPRVCPGKYLGKLEVGLVVGAIVKKFQFTSVKQGFDVKAGVSTKPADGTLVKLKLR